MNDCRGWSYVRRNQVPRLFASNVPFTILGSIEELPILLKIAEKYKNYFTTDLHGLENTPKA